MKRVLALLVLLALVTAHVAAAACVGVSHFAGEAHQHGETLPFLVVERAVIVWDAETQTEDLVREARFQKANQTFGFIVPVPSKPEIAPFASAPFDALAKKYPYLEPNQIGQSSTVGVARGAGTATDASSVVVLTKQRMGAFTSFTLATTDPAAFKTWLGANGFDVTPAIMEWIEYYTKLKFYFAAFRYEAPPEVVGMGTGEMTSQTVRIRFQTPNPYYPYSEPTPASGYGPALRLLEGWIVTREAMRPIASVTGGKTPWMRPWQLGGPTTAKPADVSTVAGGDLASLVSKADSVIVQPFRDRRLRRTGIGDALLVPSQATTFSEADVAARAPLLPVIEPRLLTIPNEPPPVDLSVANRADAGATPAPKKASCAASQGPPAGAGGGAIALAAIAALAWRRRRALVLIGLVACTRTEPGSIADAAPAESKPATTAKREPVAPETAAREQLTKDALAILAGETPDGSISEPGLGEGVVTSRGEVGLTPVTLLDGEGLPPAVDRTIARLRARVRLCYTKLLETDPKEHGQMALAVVVGPNGEVRSAEAISSQLHAKMTPCVASTLTRLDFEPRPGAKQDATMRVVFNFAIAP